MHVLAIQTAPRPRPTLQGTLNSLLLAGFGEWGGPKLIVGDGITPVITGWDIVSSKQSVGSFLTLIRLLQEATVRWPDFERLTYLQDDLVFTQNAIKYIDQFAIDDRALFVSWFSEWPKKEKTSIEVRLVRTNHFSKCQAITFKRSTVDTILALDVKGWPHKHWADSIISMLNGMYVQHLPNLVDHIAGTNSACWGNTRGERRSGTFPGEDFDAMSLTRST